MSDHKVKIETHTTDIILIDIIGYSCLSDDDQYRTIYFMNQKLKDIVDVLCSQSNLENKDMILGFVPTGDGTYIVLNHSIAGYGVLLAISLRSYLLQLKIESANLFSGLRTAIHFGTASLIKDITGNNNYLGSGLNDCARLLTVNKCIISKQDFLTDDNFIIISSSALLQHTKFYSKHKIDSLLRTIKFIVGDEISFEDKHCKRHTAHFIESSRNVTILPLPKKKA